MRNILVLVVFFLAACSGGSPPPPPPAPMPPAYPNVAPGNSSWTMIGGSFALFDFDGYSASTFDPSTGLVTVDQSTITLTAPERQTNLPARMPLDATQIATARVQSNADVPATSYPADLNFTLVERQTQTLIGEAANLVAALIDPPEPYITVNPIAGESFDTLHHVITSAGVHFDFTTRYRTIAVDVTYDGFPHAIVTTLTENPGDAGNNEMAYVWVFSGGEIAEEIIGWVAADGTIKNGAMLRRTGMGQNP